MRNIDNLKTQNLARQAGSGVQISRRKGMGGIKPQNYQNNSEDDQFEPDYHTMKKLKFPINRKRLTKGNWTLRENKIYLSFLIHNRRSFTHETTRREQRVFCQLSQLLNKKRTPDQCRSHHQKLLANLNNSIDDLIAKMERKIQIREQKICAVKIEVEKPIQTGIPELDSGSKNQTSKAQQREIEKTIERDFYRISTYKESTCLRVEINSHQIASY